MDPIVYEKTHRRMRDLNDFPEIPGVDPLGSLVSSGESGRWRFALDKKAGATGNPPSDTYSVPVSRLMLLSQNRKVPAAFLPSALSYAGKVQHPPTEVTGNDDPRKLLPKPGDDGYGDMSIIYRVVHTDNDQPDEYYRYAYTDTMPITQWYEVYHSLPSGLKFVDGAGTLVKDTISPSSGLYRRQVDLNIGTPAAHAANVLALTAGKLVHTKMSNTPASSTVPSETASSSFGGKFLVPKVTVDSATQSVSTGHVDGLAEYSLYFPDTGSDYQTPGLVLIGSDADIKPIGSANQAGTTTVDQQHPYIRVAPADHTHKMFKLKFINTGSGAVEYTGASPGESYDFNDVLKASFPAQVAGGGTYVLVSTGTTTVDSQNVVTQWGTTAWKTVDTMFPTETYSAASSGRVTVPPSGGVQLCTIGSQGAYLTSGNIYFVTVNLNVLMVNGAGTAPLGPVPTLHNLTLTLGAVSKNVAIPGTWTDSMPWTGTVSWIVKANGPSLTLEASMPGNSAEDIYVNLFGVQCTAKAVRIR